MKTTNKLPILSFVAIFFILYLDKNRYSDSTLFIIMLLLLVSIFSYILIVKQKIREKKFNKNRFLLFVVCLSFSIGIVIYQLLKFK
jgi:ABC-type Fe3+-siderophore transport system permease subunit